jgi:hypothetical protein
MTAPGIKVNRAPVLTPWAAVVAERLGYPPDLALTLGHAVAGSSARAKARGIGIANDKDHAAETRGHEPRTAFKPVRLLGRGIRPTATEAGGMLAEDKGEAADPAAVRRQPTWAFGGRLAEVRAAMAAPWRPPHPAAPHPHLAGAARARTGDDLSPGPSAGRSGPLGLH